MFIFFERKKKYRITKKDPALLPSFSQKNALLPAQLPAVARKIDSVPLSNQDLNLDTTFF